MAGADGLTQLGTGAALTQLSLDSIKVPEHQLLLIQLLALRPEDPFHQRQLPWSIALPANLHPANQDVMLRIMPATGGPVRILTKRFGSQGTINVPSWSPDSQRVAFVSYRLLK